MEQFFDVMFSRTNDRAVRLEQIDYAGESAVILLHPAQLKHIALQLCGFREETEGRIEDLQRRISILSDHLERLITAKWFLKPALESDDGCESLTKFDGLTDLAIEFDGGRLMPDGHGADVREDMARPPVCGVQGGKASVRPKNADKADTMRSGGISREQLTLLVEREDVYGC